MREIRYTDGVVQILANYVPAEKQVIKTWLVKTLAKSPDLKAYGARVPGTSTWLYRCGEHDLAAEISENSVMIYAVDQMLQLDKQGKRLLAYYREMQKRKLSV